MPAVVKNKNKNLKTISKVTENIPENMMLYKLIFLNNSIEQKLSEKEIEYLVSLKRTKINNLPVLGSFLKSVCILDEIQYDGSTASYTFCFEREEYKNNNGAPIKVVYQNVVYCRHYIYRKLALISVSEHVDFKLITDIIAFIPWSIRMKMNPQSQLNYFVPRFHEMTIDNLKLKVLSVLIPDLIRPANKSCDRHISVEADSGKYENETDFVDGKDMLLSCVKGKGRTVEFFNKYASRKRVQFIVRENGELQVDKELSNETLNEITEIIYLVSEGKDVEGLLCNVGGLIEEYLDFVHSNMLEDARRRQKSIIFSEFLELIEDMHRELELKRKLIGIYLLLNINMLIELCGTDIAVDSVSVRINLEIMEYENLSNFLRVYIGKKYDRKLTESKIIQGINLLAQIISNSSDELKMLEAYNSLKSR